MVAIFVLCDVNKNMELKPAKRKKFSAPQNSVFLPHTTRQCFEARFNGSRCWVENKEDMTDLFKMGYYGKGSLSKSEPVFNQRNDDLPDIVYEQQWLNRKRLAESVEVVKVDEKMSLAFSSLEKFVTNACSLQANCWKEYGKSKQAVTWIPNWTVNENIVQRGDLHEMVDDVLLTGELRKPYGRVDRKEMVVVGERGPRFEKFLPPPLEVLQLTLEETFFLSSALNKLAVFDENNSRMTPEEMWLKFQSAEKYFISKYVVYYWFRSRGWVVRSGLKYGGHFLLYEKGPDFCHSSYLVHVLDDDAQVKWEDLALMQRLVETFKKDILFCTVVRPPDVRDDDLKKPNVICKLSVREVICRRWIPSQQRISK